MLRYLTINIQCSVFCAHSLTHICSVYFFVVLLSFIFLYLLYWSLVERVLLTFFTIMCFHVFGEPGNKILSC